MIEYKTASSYDLRTMDEIVNVLLLDGWKLYGTPYGISRGEVHERYCQGMVRERGDAEKTEVS